MLDELRGGHGRLLRDESRLGLQAMTERSRRAGWCLGVLAAAQGIDLLRGRHEPEGLRWIVGDVMEARGLLLTPCAEELPMVVCRACRGWEICLLAALCFLQVGERSDGIVRWSATERDSTTSLSFVGRPPPTSFGAFDASHAGWPRVGMVDGQLVLSWQ